MSDTDAAAAEAAPVSESTDPVPSASEAIDKAFAAVDIKDDDAPPRAVQSTTEAEDEEPETEVEAKPDKEEKPARKAEKKPDAEPEKKATDKAKDDAKDEEEPKPVAKRTPDGKFAKADEADIGEKPDADKPAATAFPDPPTRFSADAKAAWATAPDPVKAEVHRAIRELEQGHEKYKASAQAYEDIKEYDALAKQTGTTLKAALSNYVGIDALLRKDPIAGLERICGNLKLSLRDVAAHVMGQKPDEMASKHERTIAELRQTVQQLQRQVGGVTKSIEQQRSEAIVQNVATFAASHPRFDELSEAIHQEIGHGYDLATAYERAERLNPAPAAARPATKEIPAEKPDIAAQTRKGSLSVHGAPRSGSDPANRKPPSSAQESIERAFAQLGIG
jgi:hypothetical protein